MKEAAFPNQLAAWRLYRHMTQDELAAEIGCSVASVGHWENGARRLTDKWLPKLSKALNAPSGYILDQDPNEIPTNILDIWAAIPDDDKPAAIRMLEGLTKRTGT